LFVSNYSFVLRLIKPDQVIEDSISNYFELYEPIELSVAAPGLQA